MNGVKYLVGSENIDRTGIKAFSDETCSFLAELSSSLLKVPNAARFPDIISFAYFCRKSNIVRIKEKYERELRFGRGFAFHIAPSNVPINFAFSLLFGMLSGNANVVRVSSKNFPQMEIVCAEIKKMIERYPTLANRNSVVSYPADDSINESFSAVSDVRIIWGGDSTIETFKKYRSAPRCVNIAFSDRYSFGVIDGNAVLSADDKEISTLAGSFYNDTYLMDQNACSSPHLIFWLNGSEAAKARFWDSVSNVAEAKYELQAESAVNKYMQLCRDLIDSDDQIMISRYDNLLYRVKLNRLPDDIPSLRGSCGYFYEHDIRSLEDISPYITHRFQTMCYFGINKQALTNWVVSSGMQGIDRIVPFGRSLDIMEIWDGYDIIRFCSRIVDIK